MELLTGNYFTIKLKGGSTLVMDNQDYNTFLEKIRMDVTLKMMSETPDKVYFSRDANEGKVNMLYKIIQEQKNMSEELRSNYLKVILELTKSNDKIAESYKDQQDKKS